MASSTSQNKPWLQWPFELPSPSETPDLTLYEKINDNSFLRSMHQEIRSKVFAELEKAGVKEGSIVLLQGGYSVDWQMYDTDTDKTEFRQEPFFRYVFQINEPDCYGILDVANKKTVLFVPYVSDDAQRWNGERRELSWYKEEYGVDEVDFVHNLGSYITSKLQAKKVLLLQGVNTDSDSRPRTVPNLVEICKTEKLPFEVDDSSFLYDLLVECRVIKTPKEQEYMKLCTLLSSQAHIYVMRHIQPGKPQSSHQGEHEFHCEARFKTWCAYFGGSRALAYTCICGCGVNGSILHYGHAGRPNNKKLKDGEMIVLDMGAEYNGYATDITRSYPINGRWTKEQQQIYDAVYAAHQIVIKNMKPGVHWYEMHRLSELALVTELQKIGLLTSEKTVDELMQLNLGAVFMPHGLGHLIGLNVHDVGGYVPKQMFEQQQEKKQPVDNAFTRAVHVHNNKDQHERSKELGLCYLRCGRVLQEGMCITVEPGCYFNKPWLLALKKHLDDSSDQYQHQRAKAINWSLLEEKFMDFGGVRIEDDVLVGKEGAVLLSILPTSREEVQEVFEQRWKLSGQ